ncbi:uncharacterized protein LOC143183227 [Calliopsis andreniformis]|uniref:uncharacterized protein LOC143183227 n=1 Tax=Calliopsis andreniformis TaxID=337506 RepID=UPI003FCDB3C3
MNGQAIEDRWLRINKFFGQLVGIWPGQTKSTKLLMRCFTFIVMISANVTQMAKVAISFSFVSLTDQMPFLILGFGTFLKQYNYVLNEKRLRELLGSVVTDWLTKRPKEELMILEAYSNKAVMFSTIYKVAIIANLIMFILLPFVPPVLDVLVPLEEPRSRIFIYPAYYFLDEEKYYYFIIVHMLVAACIVAFVFIAADLNLVYTVQHACALFAITGHRFERAMDEMQILNGKNADELREKSQQKVRACIDAHRETLKLVVGTESIIENNTHSKNKNILSRNQSAYCIKNDCHVVLLFLTVGLAIITFAITLMKVKYHQQGCLAMMKISMMYFTFSMFLVGQLVHVFFVTVMGQLLINSNNETFNKIYGSLWYQSSLKTQDIRILYTMVLHKCLFSPALKGGGVIDLNLVTFLQASHFFLLLRIINNRIKEEELLINSEIGLLE